MSSVNIICFDSHKERGALRNHTPMASLQYGLNIPRKILSGPTKSIPVKRKAIFDDDSESDNGAAPPQAGFQEIQTFDKDTATAKPSRKSQTTSKPLPPKPSRPKSVIPQHAADLSTLRHQTKQMAVAQTVDPTIYDYDAAYDALHVTSAAKKAAARADAQQRKPKYMENLLEAAEVRKQDQLRAKDKLLQKEREAEGEEFADKEKFVTEAYREQQEEVRRVEEEERRREEVEEGKRKGRGMSGFYRGVMDEDEVRHREAVKAAAEGVKVGEQLVVDEETEEKTAAELAREMNEKGANIIINEEGQVADKRQLLSAGLNVAPKPKSGTTIAQKSDFGMSFRPGIQQAYQGRSDTQKAQRDRQTRMMEAQLEQVTKRAAAEEAEEMQKIERAAKSRKTEGDVSSAKERYLQRKREAAPIAEKG